MKLKSVFIRFYRSFNFDYLRRHHVNAAPNPWEDMEGNWYPFVRILIDPRVTTVVGANESGKSHLLSAIEKGITGKGINRDDFCRYSQFFTVEAGKMLVPHFGFEWYDFTDSETEWVVKTCGDAGEKWNRERFMFFRTQQGSASIYLPSEGSYNHHALASKQLSEFEKMLYSELRGLRKSSHGCYLPISDNAQ